MTSSSSMPSSSSSSSSASPTAVDEPWTLITRGLQEVLGAEDLRRILHQRPLKIYWGTAPTGKPHVGYLVPLMKLVDFLRAGCEVTVLLADLHGYLDQSMEVMDWEQVEMRTRYYETVLRAVLKRLAGGTTEQALLLHLKEEEEGHGRRSEGGVGGVDAKVTMVKGSSYQWSPEYVRDSYRLACQLTVHDASKAGTEVVKQHASPVLASLLYPGLQALDEVYLKVDAQFGGIDQRKIFVLAEKYIPKLGYTKCGHLMNPMVPGLMGTKMSASDPDNKIDFLDPPEVIMKKLNKAFCEEGQVENNGVLTFCETVVFPACDLLQLIPFRLDRPEKFGGPMYFSTYMELKEQFALKQVHPGDLKKGVAQFLIHLLQPIREACDTDAFRSMAERAYPTTTTTLSHPPPHVASLKKKKKEGATQVWKQKTHSTDPLPQPSSPLSLSNGTQPTPNSSVPGEDPLKKGGETNDTSTSVHVNPDKVLSLLEAVRMPNTS